MKNILLYLVVILLCIGCKQEISEQAKNGSVSVASSGEILWQGDGSRWAFRPLINGTELILGALDGSLTVRDKKSGEVKYEFRLDGGMLAPPSLSGNIIVAVTRQGEAVAFDLVEKRELWRTPLPGKAEADPVISGTMLIIPLQSQSICAVNISDGSVEWQSTTDGVPTAPVAAGGKLFFGTSTGRVFSFDAVSGLEDWRLNFGAPVTRKPALSKQTLVVASSQEVKAISLSDGTLRWQYGLNGKISTESIIFNDLALVGTSSSQVFALSIDSGSYQWGARLGRAVVDIVSGTDSGTIVVGARDKKLYALNAGDGSVTWEQDGAGWFNIPPASDRHGLYVADKNGSIYAISL